MQVEPSIIAVCEIWLEPEEADLDCIDGYTFTCECRSESKGMGE